MSVVLRATLPVPELLARYPELAGVRIPETYRNDGVPLLLQDSAAPEPTREEVCFPADMIDEVRAMQPRERISMTASLSRRRHTRLAVGRYARLRLATRPFVEVEVYIKRVISTGRHLIVEVQDGPERDREVEVVLGPRWPFDLLVG